MRTNLQNSFAETLRAREITGDLSLLREMSGDTSANHRQQQDDQDRDEIYQSDSHPLVFVSGLCDGGAAMAMAMCWVTWVPACLRAWTLARGDKLSIRAGPGIANCGGTVEGDSYSSIARL